VKASPPTAARHGVFRGSSNKVRFTFVFTTQSDTRPGGRAYEAASPGAGARTSPGAAAPSHVALIGRNPAALDAAAALLEQHGCRVTRLAEPARADALLRDDPPELIVVDGTAGGLGPGVGGVPVLAVLDTAPDPGAWAEHDPAEADWVLRPSVPAELPARARALLNRRRRAPAAAPRPPLDARFFSLMIHDLRTPLNVIGLSLRMIGQAVPKGDPDLNEDLRFVDENFKQIERMLAQLSDYFRLFEGSEPLYDAEFSPARLVDELVEARAVRQGPKDGPVRLDVQASCPPSVRLDPGRARLALQYALNNAVAAAGDGPVVVRLRGEPGRWITELATDRPAPGSVHATELRSEVFERLCGTAAERRGMDLAIAARVTELFGGRARLDVKPAGTALVLDWPDRLAEGTADAH
jgi:signal transduction histidine kinase